MRCHIVKIMADLCKLCFGSPPTADVLKHKYLSDPNQVNRARFGDPMKSAGHCR